ncbi:hypothetical protein [Metallosphaera sp.]|uniref:hypothetical protein n=1 Tax=Metallosphaera sp. TaxID=2020860 RepID=UPI00316CFB07
MKRVINNYLIEDEGDTLRISKLDSDDDFELNVVRLSKFEIQRIDGTFIYFMDGRVKKISDLFSS